MSEALQGRNDVTRGALKTPLFYSVGEGIVDIIQ